MIDYKNNTPAIDLTGKIELKFIKENSLYLCQGVFHQVKLCFYR